MKRIIILATILLAFISCEKTSYQEQVMYLVTKSQAGFNVVYLNEDGTKITEKVVFSSKEDEWTYKHNAQKGDIVWISVLDTMPDSFVRVVIYVNGKVYKQANRDTIRTKPLIVSGVVPF